MQGRVQSWFKVRFFTGVFVTLPVILTAWLFWLFYSSVDDFMAPLYQHLLGQHLPGLGFVTAVLIIFSVGVFATNVVGRSRVRPDIKNRSHSGAGAHHAGAGHRRRRRPGLGLQTG